MNSFSVIDPVFFELGPIEVHWYGVIIALGIYIAVTLADKEATRKGYRKDFIIDLVMWVLPIAFLGARLYYVVFNLDYYLAHPGEIIQIWNGGIAIYGGLLAGAATAYWFCKKEGVSFALFLDIAAPVVLLAQAMGRWGNFINQEAHGGAVSRAFLESLFLPNWIIEQMNINGVYYQPTFLYESVWSAIGVVILLVLRRRKHLLRVGDIAIIYTMWYSFGRFFIEGLRTDSLMLFGLIRVSQALSIVLFVGALIVWWLRSRRIPEYPYYDEVTDPKSRLLLG